MTRRGRLASHRAAIRRRRAACQGFTLIELMVVIGIIALLLAVALPTAFSLVAQGRSRQTAATFNVLESAIEAFHKDNPFANNNIALRQITVDNPTPPPNTIDVYRPIRAIFDRYPPSPTAAFAPDPENLTAYTRIIIPPTPAPPYPATSEDQADPTQPETYQKYHRLLNVMQGADLAPQPINIPWKIQHDPLQTTEKYHSIECLVYALREFSPAARTILDKLPAAVLANLDRDFVYLDNFGGGPNGVYDSGNERAIDLLEVLDAWRNPIRYAIRERWQPDPNDPAVGFSFRWELRSAGPDGQFAPPFTEEKLTDDVILQGP